ncbi:hypothetical protein GCM10020255_007520 [Rhodococcus baikonurensis]
MLLHAVPMDTSGALLLNDTQWADEVLLPHRPYATNYLDRGQYRMNRDDALTMRYVEHSPRTARFDRHRLRSPRRRDACLRETLGPSRPNWVAQSPPDARTWAGGSDPIMSAVPTPPG